MFHNLFVTKTYPRERRCGKADAAPLRHMMHFRKARTWAVCACLVFAMSSTALTGCGKTKEPTREDLSAEESTDINVTLITSVLECKKDVGEKIWEALKAEGVKDIDMVGIEKNMLYVTDVDGIEYVVELSEKNEVVSVKKA